MSLNRVLEGIAEGETSMTKCAAGYLIAKSGQHRVARQVFGACAEAGYPCAMTWMGQMVDNGLGGPEDPDAAATWDRRAAEAGDHMGMFNCGLDLLRGRGVAADGAGGRSMVDRAAAMDLPVAERLQAAGYDLDKATPDADSWKYTPRF